MTGNTDMHLLVPLNKKVGAWNRKSVIIWCDHHLPHAARHFLLIELIDSGLWNVVPLLFNGCAKLLDMGRNWNILSFTSTQSIPNMLNG